MNIFKRLYRIWNPAWVEPSTSPIYAYTIPDYEAIEGKNVEIFNRFKFRITITMKGGNIETWKWDKSDLHNCAWNTLFHNDLMIRVSASEGFAVFEHGNKTISVARDQILCGEKTEEEPITAEHYYHAYGHGHGRHRFGTLGIIHE